MKSEESLKALCSNCERHLSLSKQACPFRSISNDYCEEYEEIKRDLEILEIFKKYVIIKISDTSTLDKFYYILLKDKSADDYMGFYVNKEEKDLLKEHFENDAIRIENVKEKSTT